MTNLFDGATAALGSGLSRRHVLRTVTTTVVAALSAQGAQAAESPVSELETIADPSVAPHLRALELKLRPAKGKGITRLYLRDRLPARITAPGQGTVALVPHFLDGLDGVELSIYEHPKMTLVKRLPLTLKAKAVSAAEPFLPGVTFAASRFVRVLTEPAGDDCCVSCCNGYHICASGVCCSESDPNCGHCCDYGSCGPNCNCCS